MECDRGGRTEHCARPSCHRSAFGVIAIAKSCRRRSGMSLSHPIRSSRSAYCLRACRIWNSAKKRPLVGASGSVGGISRPWAETAVPPQNGKRDSGPTRSPMTSRFVSVQWTALRAERKSAGASAKNEMSETTKAERSENLNSWRRGVSRCSSSASVLKLCSSF
jgi:hypothetical protein